MEGDNEELSFVTLLAATKNVLIWLEAQKQNGEHSKPEPDAASRNQREGDKHRQHVDCELREEGTTGK